MLENIVTNEKVWTKNHQPARGTIFFPIGDVW